MPNELKQAGPSVSVVIATYNRGGAIVTTIESVLRQTLTDFELLVIDDGSQDDTVDAVKRLPDRRIRLVCHGVNQGVAVAYNSGVRAARGNLVAFLDHDDVAEPDWLARLSSAFEANPLVGMAWGQVRQHYLDGSTGTTFLDPYASGNRKLLPVMLTRTPGASGVMVRREVFESVGLYDPDVGWMADRDLSMRVAIDGRWQVHAEPAPTFHKYATGNNLSEARNRDHIAALHYLVEKHKFALLAHPCSRAFYLYQIGRISEINNLPFARRYLGDAVAACPHNTKYLLYWLASDPRLGRFGREVIHLAQLRGRLISLLVR